MPTNRVTLQDLAARGLVSYDQEKIDQLNPVLRSIWDGHVQKLLRHYNDPLRLTYQPSAQATAEQRTKDLTETLKRFQELEVITRRYDPPSKHRHGRPIDSHLTWRVPPCSVTGLPCNTPDSLDLTTPRIGRVFYVEKLQCHIAVFPDSPLDTICPPYPGLPPAGLDDPYNPVTCFKDGTLGKWDFRYVPQVFNIRSPWRGLVKPAGEIDSHYTHLLPAPTLFSWHLEGDPAKGGRWRIDLLEKLVLQREQAEESLLSRLRSITFTTELTHDYDLPVIETVLLEQMRGWETYQEGRDAVGRLCRYIEEILALGRWLELKERQHKHAYIPLPPCVRRTNGMGVFATPEMPKEDWEMFIEAHIPVYIIGRVPDDHPLLSSSKHGVSFDADERFRTSSFEGCHGVRNSWGHVPRYRFKLDSSIIPLSVTQLPVSLQPPQPSVIQPGPHVDEPVIAWYRFWTHPLDVDQSFHRPQLSSSSPYPNTAALLFQRSCQDLFEFVSPVQTVLLKDYDHHPFFAFYRQLNFKHMKVFKEVYDTKEQYWYFERVTRKTLSNCEKNAAYKFLYPRELVTILSAYPFPGRTVDFCRTDALPGLNLSPSIAFITRSYRRTNTSRESYICTPDEPEDSSSDDNDDDEAEGPTEQAPNPDFDAYTQEVEIGTDSIEGAIGALSAAFDPNEGNDTSLGMVDLESAGFSSIEMLISQRKRLKLEMDRCLFYRVHMDLECSEISPWQPSSGGTVWPVRIAGFCAGFSAEIVPRVVGLVEKCCSVPSEDVVIVAYRSEMDGSLTADLGLRHSDDALMIWSRLHGVSVDGRCLEVRPLQRLWGPAFLLSIAKTRRVRSSDHLQERITALKGMVAYWPPAEGTEFKTALENLELAIKHKSLASNEGWSADTSSVGSSVLIEILTFDDIPLVSGDTTKVQVERQHEIKFDQPVSELMLKFTELPLKFEKHSAAAAPRSTASTTSSTPSTLPNARTQLIPSSSNTPIRSQPTQGLSSQPRFEPYRLDPPERKRNHPHRGRGQHSLPSSSQHPSTTSSFSQLRQEPAIPPPLPEEKRKDKQPVVKAQPDLMSNVNRKSLSRRLRYLRQLLTETFRFPLLLPTYVEPPRVLTPLQPLVPPEPPTSGEGEQPSASKPVSSDKGEPASASSTKAKLFRWDVLPEVLAHWKWQEACYTSLMQQVSAYPGYDFSTVQAAFGKRLIPSGLYGAEYEWCRKKLEKLPDFTRAVDSGDSSLMEATIQEEDCMDITVREVHRMDMDTAPGKALFLWYK